MATSNTNQNSTDVFLRDLLECPVCMETIKSVPVYQCTNGHVMCKDCIEKLNNCPICRNDSALVRSLKLENIVQRLEGIQHDNEGPATSNPNLQKWGKGSVRVYGTSDGPNQQPRIEPNLQSMPRQATPRQITNNQDEEAALLQREHVENRDHLLPHNIHQATPRQATLRQEVGALLLDWVENRPRSITNFLKNVGILFLNIIWIIILVIGVFLFVILLILAVMLPFVVLICIAYFTGPLQAGGLGGL